MQGKELIVESKLATELSDVQDDPLKVIMTIYGEPGVGKTTMASQMETPYFICTERGQSFVKYIGTRVNNWRDVREQITALCEEEHAFKTVVIDTVSALWDMLVDEVCRENNWGHLSEGSFKAYDLCKIKMSKMLGYLSQQEFGIVLLGHEVIKETEYLGVKKEVYRPQMIVTCWNVINAYSDMIGRMFVKPQMVAGHQAKTRHISFAPSPQFVAKDHSGILEKFDSIEVDPVEMCWANVASKFNKEKQDD